MQWREQSYWRQLAALNHCLLAFGATTRWLAVIDVDEFLFAPPAPSASASASADVVVDVATLLDERYANASVVRIAWHMFSDRASSESDLVTARFEWRGAAPLLGSVTLLNDTLRNGAPVRIVAGKSIFRPSVRLLASEKTTNTTRALF